MAEPTPAALARVSVPAAHAGAWLRDHGFTDGLPVVAPREDLVGDMVDAIGRDPGEVLGVMPPQFAAVTVEKVAVCAVIAGCPPEAGRVVVACAEAMLGAAFRVASVQSTTSPATPFFVVSGPEAATAGMADGTGSLGPDAGTNFVIGRACRLLLGVVGGARVGDGDPASLGMPAKLSACCAERTSASPWPSLGARRGADVGETAVVAFPITGMWQISEPNTAPDEVAHQILHGMINLGHCSQPKLPQPGEQLLVLSPPIAQILAQRFGEVTELQRALFETVRVPLSWVPPYKRAATVANLDALGVEWRDGLVPLAEGPDSFVIVVSGGDAGVQSMGMSTLTLCRSAMATVSRR